MSIEYCEIIVRGKEWEENFNYGNVVRPDPSKDIDTNPKIIGIHLVGKDAQEYMEKRKDEQKQTIKIKKKSR